MGTSRARDIKVNLTTGRVLHSPFHFLIALLKEKSTTQKIDHRHQEQNKQTKVKDTGSVSESISRGGKKSNKIKATKVHSHRRPK